MSLEAKPKANNILYQSKYTLELISLCIYPKNLNHCS